MSIIDKVEVDGTIYDIVGGGILPHLVISTDSGLTVTATKGTTVITATETSSGVYECDVPEFGTYTITATKGSEVVTKEFNVTSVSIFNIVLSFIPDGETVLPTDDVTTWLECAGIKDKSYTTLQQVLSDSVTFNTLLGDSNANAYFARSTTWATTICASQYAMNLIGQYDVCCDALLANATWNTAINNSPYWNGHTDSGEKIHGANNEVAYYLDGATKIPISNPSTLDAGTYTFGSTVAKNPDSLSSDYTKSIRITPNTVEVVLRPDNALYWYGYESSDLCDTTSANGYSWVGGSVGAPTHNTHDITCTTSSKTMKGIAVTDAINLSKIYVVVKGVTVVSGDYGLCYILTSKNISVPAINSSETITSASVTKITVNATAQGNYVPVIASYNGKSARIDALMYE